MVGDKPQIGLLLTLPLIAADIEMRTPGLALLADQLLRIAADCLHVADGFEITAHLLVVGVGIGGLAAAPDGDADVDLAARGPRTWP